MPFVIGLIVGLLVGAMGTLIGAGGGFVLMPILLFTYRGANPEILTAWSLVAVVFNAYRHRNIALRSRHHGVGWRARPRRI
jgi:uncharacterized membrane protein YfcA